MSLSIHLNTPWVLFDRKSSAHLGGFVKLSQASYLPETVRLQFIGTEYAGNECKQVCEHTLDIEGSNKWIIAKDEKDPRLMFTFDLPNHLPGSFQASAYDGGLEYNLVASTQSAKGEIHAVQPIVITRSPVLQPPRLCWGTSSSPLRRWHYEVEAPQVFCLHQTPSLKVRVRSALHRPHFQATLETCLIGIQLFESVRIGKEAVPKSEPLITLTQLLVAPSLSWNSPCEIAIPAEFERLPSADLSTPLQSIQHRLRITLAFCNAQGESDHVNQEFPITVISGEKSKESIRHHREEFGSDSETSSLDSALGVRTFCYSSSSSM
ncbi:hypothetical protein J3Q64DRAFT_1729698 [Phycomyces blakesleeanus]|uniref:Arrestin-like N-terminal domain-containing protein n=2 Tax=Phycomyces blakesleeanus TaxID=4837 RepID=A0A162Q0W6_PHYB8|nr:hypothetical protein PHYBLDRAFT_166160 [Phycomyces blakesleeanus NRRL 1555(-)]OAD76186.1 hypothetical protein PHYBLDRAFT_166160 [Phycomyces blakesleeanus NRRL 1555(-)]|eukprot:XP_018294226.1 hypothetical protein PHYBLDRAFT_166160 [Phycomyces blakesleeanus NRRL 1555(-)]